METSPELLESLRDESERPTIRLPVRAPLAPLEEAELIVDETPADPPVRQRVVFGPDGVPRTLYEDELEEATRPYVPPKVLLGRGKARKKR